MLYTKVFGSFLVLADFFSFVNKMRDQDTASFLYRWISNFLCVLCWRSHFFSKVHFCHLCWNSGGYYCTGLFLDLRLHPTALGMCFGAGSTVLLYFPLSSIAWFEIGFAVLSAWLILHKVASAVWCPFVSMGTWNLFSYFLWTMALEFWWRWLEFVWVLLFINSVSLWVCQSLEPILRK